MVGLVGEVWKSYARAKGKVEYSRELLDVADTWPTYEDYLTDNEGNSWPVIRCAECNNAILHVSTPGVAYHLITTHGYRMDGRHEDVQAAEARAAAERGEMNAIVGP